MDNWNYKETEMYKEIMEEPESIIKTVDSIQKSLNVAGEALKKADFVFLVGNGTSYHAGRIMAQHLVLCGEPAMAVRASEFYCYASKWDRNVLAIMISQSGDNVDIIRATDLAISSGFNTLAVTNTMGSYIDRKCGISLITAAGEEKSLAATKSHIAQIAALYALSERVFKNESIDTIKNKLTLISSHIENILSIGENLNNLYSRLLSKVIFLGDGYLYSVAKEGALKFEETAGIPTEAYPLAEYLHGPIHILSSTHTVIIMGQQDTGTYKRVYDEISKITKNIISIGPNEKSDIKIPGESGPLSSLLYLPVIQLMANWKTVSSGMDPDHPERLKKIVK
ncbi:MAG: SIS domain-containing protein [Ferroplasma sp.]|uniref:SIS domain-containing protein n=1 Tax=Ferroplasma sp. TaxID=2591003 RepID=UPI0028151FCB|nr:SIS domain-containing protein [Ferroplasma sp.]WMT50557.1 MAG: SIS domain-containing protein [Ferroplasma sp.]